MEDRNLKVTGFCIGSELTKSQHSFAVDVFAANGQRVTVFVPISLSTREKVIEVENEEGTLVEQVQTIDVFNSGHYYDFNCLTSRAGEPLIDHTSGEQLLDDNGEPRFAKSDAIRALKVKEIAEEEFDKLSTMYAKFAK